MHCMPSNQRLAVNAVHLYPPRLPCFMSPQRCTLHSLPRVRQMLSSMASARGLGGGAGPGSAVREAVEAAPLLPTPAIQAKLLDGTKYR